MLNRLLTWLSTREREPKKVKQLYDWTWAELVKVKQATDELVATTTKLSDRLDELQSEHRKLRGRFYAARGEVEPGQPQSREDMKRAAFARAGYIPGKPARHEG